MASEYLVSNLITAARDSGMLPQQTDATDDARVLATLNREQRTRLAALLRKTREEYQNASTDVALVAGTTRYRIPSRAMGAALKAVRLVSSEHPNGRDLLPCPERRMVDGPGDYYLDGNYIVLRSTSLSGTYLRIVYPRRLGTLVAASAACAITAIDTGTGALTVTLSDETGTVPATFTTSKRYDLIRSTPHFDVLAADLTASAVGAGSVTFSAADLPSELSVGDFVALAGQTPICQAPVELHDVLVAYGLRKLQAGRLNAQGKKDSDQEIAELETLALDLLQPRVENEDEVIVNPHGIGWGNFARRDGWRR